MEDIRLIGDKAMNNILSHALEVQFGVKQKTEEIAVEAEALLAPHRKTGEAHIETSYGKTDGFVSLVDPDADSINFGHFRFTEAGFPVFVEGLHVIEKAAGLI